MNVMLGSREDTGRRGRIGCDGYRNVETAQEVDTTNCNRNLSI